MWSGRDIEPRPPAREPCAEPLSHKIGLTITHSDSPDDIVHYGLARKHKNRYKVLHSQKLYSKYEWNFSVNLCEKKLKKACKLFKIFASNSRQQIQFHATYPLFNSQSDREFTFSNKILSTIFQCHCIQKYLPTSQGATPFKVLPLVRWADNYFPIIFPIKIQELLKKFLYLYFASVALVPQFYSNNGNNHLWVSINLNWRKL